MRDLLVRVVIVNYNGGTLLAKAVDSIVRQTTPNEIVVVDNASTDDSLASLAPYTNVRIVRSAVNLGFGAGVNRGARGATTPFIATLNPDAVADPRWLGRCLAWMTRDGVDLATCLIGAGDAYYFTSGTWHRTRGAALAHHDGIPRTCDWINGCALIVRRTLFERLRGFDENYFLYSEDVDFSLRATHDGAKLAVLSERLVEHAAHGRSSASLGDRKHDIAFGSRGRLVARHVPAFAQPLACVVQAFVVPALWSRSVRTTMRLARAFAGGYVGRPLRPADVSCSGTCFAGVDEREAFDLGGALPREALREVTRLDT